MRLCAALAGLAALGVTPALAVPAQYDIAFVSEFADGEHAVLAGFSGLVLKFETSEPDPGAVVPSTSC